MQAQIVIDWQSALSEAHDEIARLRAELSDRRHQCVNCKDKRQTENNTRQTTKDRHEWQGTI